MIFIPLFLTSPFASPLASFPPAIELLHTLHKVKWSIFARQIPTYQRVCRHTLQTALAAGAPIRLPSSQHWFVLGVHDCMKRVERGPDDYPRALAEWLRSRLLVYSCFLSKRINNLMASASSAHGSKIREGLCWLWAAKWPVIQYFVYTRKSECCVWLSFVFNYEQQWSSPLWNSYIYNCRHYLLTCYIIVYK